MIVAHARCYTDNSHSIDFEKKNHPKRYKKLFIILFCVFHLYRMQQNFQILFLFHQQREQI